MSVHTAQPGDIYRDEQGGIWRVTWVCHEPTVGVERMFPGEVIEPGMPYPSPVNQSGGVSGAMWRGFRKLEPTQK